MSYFQNFWQCDSIDVPKFVIREPANLYVPMHWHNACEIIMMTDGAGEIVILDQKHVISKGEMIIINSQELHSSRAIGENTSCILMLPDSFWQQNEPNIPVPKFPNIPDEGSQNILTEQLNRMIQMNGRKSPEDKAGFYEAMFSFLRHLLSNRLSDTTHLNLLSEIQQRRLDLINEYIDEHYTENVSLQEIASIISLQPNYFCRFFKETTGRTLQTYINEYRMNRVHYELIHTNDNILDIINRHGFTNERIFRRLFREFFGCTPSEYRRREFHDGKTIIEQA